MMSALENTCRGLIFSIDRDLATFRGKHPGNGQEWVQNGVWWVRHKGNIVLHLVSKNCIILMKIATSAGKNGTSIWGKQGGNRGKQGKQRPKRGQTVIKAYYHI